MAWTKAIYRAFGADELPLGESIAIMNPQRLTGTVERAGVVVWRYDTSQLRDLGAPTFDNVNDAVEAMRANGATLTPISGGAHADAVADAALHGDPEARRGIATARDRGASCIARDA